MIHHSKTILMAAFSLVLLSGCASTTSQQSAKDTSVKTTYVSKRTKADQKAWAAAKADSEANAASAKKLSESESVLAKADEEASSQAESLSSSHSESVESVKAASSSAASAALAESKAAAKSAASASSAAAEQSSTQPSAVKPDNGNHANHFSGDTDTAQQGRIVGNSRSKIYHVETGHNYHMSGKNAVYFNTEAEAQASGYRKSLR